MEEPFSCRSRPTQTTDLIGHLKHASNSREKDALQALVTRMVEIFNDGQKPSYVPEASAISEITNTNDYQTLVFAFSKAIIAGTTDEKPIDRELLRKFTYCLRRAKNEIASETAQLGSVLGGLNKQLTSAKHAAQPEAQYYLVCTIGNLLDAMVDIKIGGIDREVLHTPLLKQLQVLKHSQEPRMAQAAEYAYQALLKIPDNESPWECFCRNSWTIIQATANVAGAVSTMDPTKLVDAAPDLMKILEFFKNLVETGKQVYHLSKDGKSALLEGIRSVSSQQGWYAALRYTDMLIKAHAFEMLEYLLKKGLCSDKEHFMCGFYAQLERAWCREKSVRGDIEKLIQVSLPLPLGYKRAVQWINLVAETTGKSEWKPKEEKSTFPNLFRRKKGKSSPKLKMFDEKSGSDEMLAQNLLEAAWGKCDKAKLFYADAVISKYYTEKGRLNIVRLSGELLPMRECYINLSILESSTDGALNSSKLDMKDGSVSEFSITKRLKIDNVVAEKELRLPGLFDERILNNRMINPKRILIRGRAGVGKTTLCKKIVHDFVHDGMWARDFDRILWIPLRHLRRHSNPEAFIEEEFFSETHEGQCLFSSFKSTIWNDTNSRTLFLLDGLDEVSRDHTELGSGLKTTLMRLLNQPNVVITSRPYGIKLPGLNELDLEIETVGFRPEQVTAYLTKVVGDEDKVEAMQNFVKQHWVIQGLIQIPIQLDAFAFTWGDKGIVKNPPNNMTSLYQAIELKLWMKDIPRIRDEISDTEVQNLRTRSKIQPHIKEESEFLELLAFTGLYNDMAEFSQDDRDQIYDLLPLSKVDDNILEKVSFLRAIDGKSNTSGKEYYFIHLTFQEFFAARYFVRCWAEGKQLTCLKLGSISRILDIDDFISHEKYNERYNIMWRFVAGLLAVQTNDSIVKFIEQLETEPRDLLGPAHIRLLMHCFSEITLPDQNKQLDISRNSMECRLAKLFLFEGSPDKTNETKQYTGSRDIASLGVEMEFPECVIQTILDKGTEKYQHVALQVLASRQQISLGLLNQVASFLDDHHGRTLQKDAALVIGKNPQYQPELTMKLLHSDEVGIRAALRSGLEKVRTLRDEILLAMISSTIFHMPPFLVPDVIHYQTELSEVVVQGLISYFGSDDPDARKCAVDCIRPQLPQRNDILNATIPLLGDPERVVRASVALALIYHSNLPKHAIESLVLRLEIDDDPLKVQSYAAMALGNQNTLSPDALHALRNTVETQNMGLQFSACHALYKHSALSAENQMEMFQHSTCKDTLAISMVELAFTKQADIPEEIMSHCLSLLDSKKQSLRMTTAMALAKNPELPQSIIDKLLLRLDDPIIQVRRQVLSALANQKHPSEHVLKRMMTSCVRETKRSTAERRALGAMAKQKALPAEVLPGLVSLLNDPKQSGNAGLALVNQTDLPRYILDSVTLLLIDPSRQIKTEAEKVLRKYPSFYANLHELGVEYWISWFRVLLKRSFKESVVCYVKSGFLCIDIPEGSFKVSIEDPGQREKLDKVLEEIRNDIEESLDGNFELLGFPSE